MRSIDAAKFTSVKLKFSKMTLKLGFFMLSLKQVSESYNAQNLSSSLQSIAPLELA